eukprot:1475001-Pyramimonas_sp.AAC.1
MLAFSSGIQNVFSAPCSSVDASAVGGFKAFCLTGGVCQESPTNAAPMPPKRRCCLPPSARGCRRHALRRCVSSNPSRDGGAVLIQPVTIHRAQSRVKHL